MTNPLANPGRRTSPPQVTRQGRAPGKPNEPTYGLPPVVHASEPHVDVLPLRARDQLPAGAVPLPAPRRAREDAVHAVQAGGHERNVAEDLQPRRKHHGALHAPVRSVRRRRDTTRGAPPRQVTDFATTLPSSSIPGSRRCSSSTASRSAPSRSSRTISGSASCSRFAPALLIIGLYVWIFRRAPGRAAWAAGSWASDGAPRAASTRTRRSQVTFDDVAGIEEAENELVEIVDFLKDPQKYTRLGGSAPKGVLLIGAPGTGKTLARTRGGRRGRRALLLHERLGVRRDDRGRRGGARARSLQAGTRERPRDHLHRRAGLDRPCARTDGDRRRRAEQEQTLNQILTEMDGFSGREGIIVLAATNQPDVLDQRPAPPGPLRPPRRDQSARPQRDARPFSRSTRAACRSHRT